MKNYQSLTGALADLRKRGYEADFSTDTDCLYCGDIDIRLDPDDFHFDEVYRFEAVFSPDEFCNLYAVTSASGVKGTIVDAHGNYSSNLNLKMAK